jgi:single-stranded DNA-binding protein
MADKLPPDGMNRCFFQGYVGQAPDVRTNVSPKTGEEFLAASFSLGVNSSYRNGNNEKVAHPTAWPRFSVTGKLAEIVRDYVEVGQQLTVISAYNMRKDIRDENKPAYYHEFLLDRYGCQLFLGPKSGQGGGTPSQVNVEQYKEKVLTNMKLQDWNEADVAKLKKLLDVTQEAEMVRQPRQPNKEPEKEVLDDDIPFGV